MEGIQHRRDCDYDGEPTTTKWLEPGQIITAKRCPRCGRSALTGHPIKAKETPDER